MLHSISLRIASRGLPLQYVLNRYYATQRLPKVLKKVVAPNTNTLAATTGAAKQVKTSKAENKTSKVKTIKAQTDIGGKAPTRTKTAKVKTVKAQTTAKAKDIGGKAPTKTKTSKVKTTEAHTAAKVETSPVTAETVLSNIVRNLEKKYGIREAPPKLAATPFSSQVSRESEAVRVYSLMATRLRNLRNEMTPQERETGILSNNNQKYPREINSLVALSTTPGTGKSYFGDLLASHVYIDKCDDNELKQILLSSKVLVMSFNYPTELQHTETDPNQMLVMRALFSHLQITDFESFVASHSSELANFSFLQLVTVLKANCPLLAIYDEIAEVAANVGWKVFNQVVSLASRVMDKYPDYNCFMTTLDSVVLDASLSSSKRLHEWVYMHDPTVQECLRMFGDPPAHSALFQAILDSRCHLRTLALIHLIVNDGVRRNNALSYQAIIKELAGFALKANLNSTVIVPALLGTEVTRGTRTDESHTFNTYLKSGAIYCTGSPQLPFIPTIIPLNLRAWANTNHSMLATYLRDIFARLDQLPALISSNKDNQGGTGFENFCFSWLQMYMHLQSGKTMTISEFFKLGNIPHTDSDYEITIPARMSLYAEKAVFENATGNPCKNILSFAHSTAGIDGCSAHYTTTPEELVVIGYQIKFSRTESSDTLQRNEVVDAHNKFLATLATLGKNGAQWLAGRTIRPILVVFCARTLPKFKTQLPDGIIILSRTDIARLLTPSLDIYQHFFQNEKLRTTSKFIGPT